MRSVSVLGWVRAGRGSIAMCLVMCLASACALAFASSPALAAGPPEAPITGSVATVEATIVVIFGELNPKGEGEAGTYEFLYNASATKCTGGSATSPGAVDGSAQTVGEEIGGLTPHTTYTICLLDRNEANETTLGPPVTFKTTEPPEAPETLPATAIGATTATLHGVLSPKGEGEAGTYEFLYKESASECEGASATTRAAALGTTQSVSAEATKLAPGATYTFCLLDRNSAGETTVGPPVAFKTEAAPPAVVNEYVTQDTATSATLNAEIDPDGAETSYHFQYGTTVAYGQSTPETALLAADSSEHRAAAALQNLQPGTVYHYRVVASNQRSATGGTDGPDEIFTTEAGNTEFALPDGRVWELVSPANKNGAEVETYKIGYGGELQAAENGDAATYIASAPFGAGGASDPIESQILSRRGPAGGWSSEDLNTRHNEATVIENGGGLEPHFGELAEYRAFSPDLSLAFVAPEGHTQLGPTPPVKGGENEPETYIRDNGTGSFTSTTLTAYEWYAEQVALADGPPSCDASTAPDHEAEVDAVSQNGCYVYFNAEAGSGQLYVSHDEGGEWTTTPLPNLNGQIRWHFTKESQFENGYRTATGEELSPDGRYLAFMSSASLTGYDNRDAVSSVPDEEVYLYDAVASRLVCVSCDPSGARETGVLDRGSTWSGKLLVDRDWEWPEQTLAGSLADWMVKGQSEPFRQPRYLSDSGRLFFNSPVALVPQDVNGLEDVYEYEPAGVGGETGCGPGSTTFSQTTGGCLGLISSGTSRQESALVEASASGDDVFFLTGSGLAAQDYDGGFDMYDAHACAVSAPCPLPAALVPPACDTSDSCKPAPTPQPAAFGVPSSATFSGSGNIAPQLSQPVSKKKPKKRASIKKKPKKHSRKKHQSAKRNQRRGK